MIKVFLALFFSILLISNTNANPKCQGEDYTKWTNCFGEYTNSNGRVYEGEFGEKPGERDGFGSSKTTDGTYFIGEYKNDKAVKGKILYTDGSYYEGTYNDKGNFHGNGKFFVKKNNTLFSGNWIDHKMQGMVIMENLNNNTKLMCKTSDGKVKDYEADCKPI